ncbi:NAD-dependent epimerase/dehydratase family protein [Streptomyces sp. ISL-98]|uniref:NAD-dependent epimerase/dehydratase family protein n=1 Tax=Streptomyces sp. ISL-98 TaxID=2819192 RepID=UPI001BE8B779|nr:NAD-dependent epimerase/dehydratase family protein [Streptomyces sp. ISL-98]MBT2507777.1 NAD-dependent epimerase/dehydratase family protein [Streptomyces sp. ISL-98]
MRFLILGGTAFLGRAVARHALAAGHDVTCVARGSSGSPVAGVRFVRADRDDPDGLSVLEGEFDAVVDVTRRPSHVRHALGSLAGRVGHFTFVSTGSVYSDNATPGQRANTAPLVAPAPPEADDPGLDPAVYGPCKVTCEQLVRDALEPGRVFVCRAGLVVGPEDPLGRFDYWLRRVGASASLRALTGKLFAIRGGEILVPGAPEDLVQFIDVRGLAAWIVEAGEQGLTGTFDGIGAPMTWQTFLTGLADGDITLTCVPQDFLFEQRVAPWAGPRSLPMWLPLPQCAGFMSRDVTPSLAAGLRSRPLAETARDTAGRLRGTGHAIALTAAEEADVLRAWNASLEPGPVMKSQV